MTYAMGDSLQMAIYSRLSGDPAMDTLLGGAIYDAVPQSAPDLFVALGPERVRDASDKSGAGALHEMTISVVTTGDGYLAAKEAAALVSDTLLSGALTLTRGRVVYLRFLRARARRDRAEGTRRIDMTFRARLDDDNS
ncbi:DUF3168 domain-containing protein [Jannaschia sp. M317]|uniref:DUF3168 domain-containing protein n=1 Tax=Jannaschia sp. M317 TaxID=2867011 RepID=UPI0021A8A925|nr:DUF3168 domain-containing protein [Jannaschia sp. M317]UWQ16988.1 DUF3168 domain-containing protein [Jannaschia sp. M317]